MADRRPKHKPNEKHTLDEVLKSLQDLVRNQILEPPASPAPADKPAPISKATAADVRNIINSLEDLLNGGLGSDDKKHAARPAAKATKEPPPKLNALIDNEIELPSIEVTPAPKSAPQKAPTDGTFAEPIIETDNLADALKEIEAELSPPEKLKPKKEKKSPAAEPAPETSIQPKKNRKTDQQELMLTIEETALPAIEVEETSWSPDAEAAFASDLATDLQTAADEITAATPPASTTAPAAASFGIDFTPNTPAGKSTSHTKQPGLEKLSVSDSSGIDFTPGTPAGKSASQTRRPEPERPSGSDSSIDFTPGAPAGKSASHTRQPEPERPSVSDSSGIDFTPGTPAGKSASHTRQPEPEKPSGSDSSGIDFTPSTSTGKTVNRPRETQPRKTSVAATDSFGITPGTPTGKNPNPAEEPKPEKQTRASAPAKKETQEPDTETELTLEIPTPHSLRKPERDPELLEDLTPPLVEEDVVVQSAATPSDDHGKSFLPLGDSVEFELPGPDAAPALTLTADLTAPSADDIPVLEDVALHPPETTKPTPPAVPSNMREVAVKIIAKLNIELRKSGEQPLSPKVVNRLQQLLGEVLDPHK